MAQQLLQTIHPRNWRKRDLSPKIRMIGTLALILTSSHLSRRSFAKADGRRLG